MSALLRMLVNDSRNDPQQRSRAWTRARFLGKVLCSHHVHSTVLYELLAIRQLPTLSDYVRALLSTMPGGPDTLRIGALAEPVPAPGAVVVGVHGCGVDDFGFVLIQDL